MSEEFGAEEFRIIFEKTPRMCLIFDSSYKIIAQNDAHEAATMTKRENTVGRSLFEVFPDNPDDSSADGLSNLRRSLLHVMEFRSCDTIESLRFDIVGPSGGFETHFWRVTNTPVLGKDGYVKFIINSVDDITELTLLREGVAKNTEPRQPRSY